MQGNIYWVTQEIKLFFFFFYLCLTETYIIMLLQIIIKYTNLYQTFYPPHYHSKSYKLGNVSFQIWWASFKKWKKAQKVNIYYLF